MARAKKDESEFIVNAREPSFGPGIYVKKDGDRRVYRFADGQERSFKEAYCELYIKPAYSVSDEVKAKLKPSKVAASIPPKHVNEELEAQIRAKPDEPGPYLVYADWLIQRSDPRGDLITVQAQLAETPRKKELLDAEKKLLDAHPGYFLPPALDEALRKRTAPRCEVTWSHGFFKSVRLARGTTAAAQDINLDVVAKSVLAHSSGKFLRSLVLGPLGTSEYWYAPLISEIAKQQHAMLNEIVVGDFGPGDIELTSTVAGTITPLFRAAPALQKLAVKAGSLKLDGKVGHPQLRELSITTVQLAGDHMRALFAGEFPALETLSIVTESLVFDDDQRVALTAGFLWPALRHLTLRGVKAPKALLDALIDSPLTARLASLDLGLDAAAMKKLITKHPHLELGRADDKRFAITDSQVVRRAPDPESMAAARKLARADKWLALGFDRRRDRVWGEYEGRDHYYVYAQLRGREAGCDCGSPKDPCKHALALLLLAANQHDFAEQASPDALVRNASQERPRYYASTWE